MRRRSSGIISVMWGSLARTVGSFTDGEEAQRNFDLAAERIQTALLEVALPAIDGLELGVHAEPARLVGGDYIDVFVPAGGPLVFCLGDASGKSLAAALNALMLRYLLRGLVRALGHHQLEAIMGHANSVVADDFRDGDQFITLVLGSMDVRSGTLTVVNAGHEPPLILRAGSPDIDVMTGHSIVLGIARDVRYQAEQATLDVGDRAMIYTDGLTEATNDRGELFTIERLRETFLAHRELGAQALADKMFEVVKAYAGKNMRDDATILVIHRTGLQV